MMLASSRSCDMLLREQQRPAAAVCVPQARLPRSTRACVCGALVQPTPAADDEHIGSTAAGSGRVVSSSGSSRVSSSAAAQPQLAQPPAALGTVKRAARQQRVLLAMLSLAATPLLLVLDVAEHAEHAARQLHHHVHVRWRGRSLTAAAAAARASRPPLLGLWPPWLAMGAALLMPALLAARHVDEPCTLALLAVAGGSMLLQSYAPLAVLVWQHAGRAAAARQHACSEDGWSRHGSASSWWAPWDNSSAAVPALAAVTALAGEQKPVQPGTARTYSGRRLTTAADALRAVCLAAVAMPALQSAAGATHACTALAAVACSTSDPASAAAAVAGSVLAVHALCSALLDVGLSLSSASVFALAAFARAGLPIVELSGGRHVAANDAGWAQTQACLSLSESDGACLSRPC